MNNSIDIGSCSRDYIEYNDQGMNEIPLYSSTSSQPHEINDGHYINLEDQENKFSLAYNNVESQSQEGSSYFSYWTYITNIAHTIKEKITNSEIGSKVIYFSSKALEYVYYAGEKVYEKSIGYIRQKIVVNPNTAGDENYHSVEGGGEALIDKSNVVDI